jgi:hypothetical protein
MKKLSAILFATILAAMLVGVGMGQQKPTEPHKIHVTFTEVGKKFAYRSAVPVCLVAEGKIARVTIRPDGLLDVAISLDIDEYQNPPKDFACSTITGER